MLAEPQILMSKKTLVQILGLKVHDEFIKASCIVEQVYNVVQINVAIGNMQLSYS